MKKRGKSSLKPVYQSRKQGVLRPPPPLEDGHQTQWLGRFPTPKSCENPAIQPRDADALAVAPAWRQGGARYCPSDGGRYRRRQLGARVAPEWRHGGATINSQNLWRQRGASLAPSWRQRCDGPEIFSRHHPFLHLPPVFLRRS